MTLGDEGLDRYSGLVMFPDGYSRPGDGLAPPYVWDDGRMQPAKRDGGAIIVPPVGIDAESTGCTYHFDADEQAWIPDDPGQPVVKLP